MTDDSLDIQLIRRKAGLTQKDMAEKLGVSQAQISRYESNPGSIEYEKLAKWIRCCTLLLGNKSLPFSPALVVMATYFGYGLTNEELRFKMNKMAKDVLNEVKKDK